MASWHETREQARENLEREIRELEEALDRLPDRPDTPRRRLGIRLHLERLKGMRP